MPRTHDNHNEGRCYGCGAEVPDVPGSYYCDACVDAQAAEYYGGSELAAFDAYHAAIDKIAATGKR